MAFKMSYSFEGNYRNRPEQNLSGTSRKQSRDVLLQRVHEEREKRHTDRLRLHSAEIIQTYTRSYLVRKKIKMEQRQLYDANESNCPNKASQLSKLLFFYDADQDSCRLVKICTTIMRDADGVMHAIQVDSIFCNHMKKLLKICITTLTKDKFHPIIMDTLCKFSHNSDIITYLLSTGYYLQLREFLDSTTSYKTEALNLIHRPFVYININENIRLHITREFTKNFMSNAISMAVKNDLIPFLKEKGNFPFEDFVTYLCRNKFDNPDNILYVMLSLEPENYLQTHESIYLLSLLTIGLHEKYTFVDLSKDDDESDDEQDIVLVSDIINLQEYLSLLNNQKRVKAILNHFMNHVDESMDLLDALIKLCHNLLLIDKRKFMLVYMLALNGTFLNKLWMYIKRTEQNFSLATTSIPVVKNMWKDDYLKISVFCNMFTFYTETLTETGTSDTSQTFRNDELAAISDMLKTVTLNLVEIAFPMCRSNKSGAAKEILHLYHSSMKALRKLHMLDLRKKFCGPNFWTKRKVHISRDLTKNNYLGKSMSPFNSLLSSASENDDDERLPPLSSIEQRSLAIMKELPFLIEFNERVMILRELCYHNLTSRESRLHNEFLHDGVITVRRAFLYEDSFEKISQVTDMRRKLRIQFINNAGVEEVGIDGGGIFKEFLNEVLKTAFDPNRGFFSLTADNMLYPNPQVHLIMENYEEHFYFIGKLIGKAIFENILVDLPLAEFFLAKLLVERANAYYLESLDPILYRNLLYLRDYKGNVLDLGLDFTLVHNDLGETRIYELVKDGANIAVTNDNRLDYIHRLADLKLNTLIKKQCTAFREGINSVVPLMWLQLFSHVELQVIISGDTQEIDLKDLSLNTIYGGEYSAEHPTIIMFWNILRSFTENQKKLLLKFVTSCSRPPLLGFKELNPLFGIQSSGSEDRMPTASTCLNLLKLPIIGDEEVLRTKLLAAIEQQAGFELS